MKTNVLAVAAALSDQDLLARLDALADREREASVDLVAHLAALDTRPSLYAAKGYSSLFNYCTEALKLSEDAACNRIEAARASRRFPVILDLLSSGDVTLTSVRLLGRHLTPENHQAVLARARGRRRPEIEALVAELAPRPDVPTSVRRLPMSAPTPAPLSPPTPGAPSESAAAIAPPPAAFVPAPRPIVQCTAPQRYRIQFTVGQETYEELQRLQRLLRREIPNGDPGAIFARALPLLREKVERTKLGATARPRPGPVIRPGTDNSFRTPPPPPRYIPMAVRRAVYRRDGGQCAFVSKDGRRCTEREFLEFHHLDPYARGGPPTVDNTSLRWRHNQYEAELIFGPYGASVVREGGEPWISKTCMPSSSPTSARSAATSRSAGSASRWYSRRPGSSTSRPAVTIRPVSPS